MKQRRHVADMLLDALAYVHSRQTQHRDLKHGTNSTKRASDRQGSWQKYGECSL